MIVPPCLKKLLITILLLGMSVFAVFLYLLNREYETDYALWENRYESRSVFLLQSMESLSSYNGWTVFVSLGNQKHWLHGPTSRDSFDAIREVYWTKDYRAVCVEYGMEKPIKVGFDFDSGQELREAHTVALMIKKHRGPGPHIHITSRYVKELRGPDQGLKTRTDISPKEAESWLKLIPASPKP